MDWARENMLTKRVIKKAWAYRVLNDWMELMDGFIEPNRREMNYMWNQCFNTYEGFCHKKVIECIFLLLQSGIKKKAPRQIGLKNTWHSIVCDGVNEVLVLVVMSGVCHTTGYGEKLMMMMMMIGDGSCFAEETGDLQQKKNTDMKIMVKNVTRSSNDCDNN